MQVQYPPRVQISRTSPSKDSKVIFEAVISTKDYEALLKFYNRKSLPVHISSLLGLSGGWLSKFIVRLAKGDDRDEIRKRLKKIFCGFPC